jgi:3-oxosteroid 1-dehydrogenase
VGTTRTTAETRTNVVVVGSGAGGMTAALAAKGHGLDVILVEKTDMFGGSTAMSGGAIWIPNNPTLVRHGLGEDPEQVRLHLRCITAGEVADARIDAFVDGGPEAMRFLEHSGPHLRFAWVPNYPDYHPDLPGGSSIGRAVEPLPLNLRRLGEDEKLLRPSAIKLPMGLWVTGSDAKSLGMVMRTKEGRRSAAQAAHRVVAKLVTRRRMAAMGQALAGRLRLALQDAAVPVWLNSPLVELLVGDGGRIEGVVISRDGEQTVIRADSVILAAGGFDHDPTLRTAYQDDFGEDWSSGAPGNTGDGIRAGMMVGAGTALLDESWWMPAFRQSDGWMFPLVIERCIPRSIIVNHAGARFANESAPYSDFVRAQLAGHRGGVGHVPAWFIMDRVARRRYQFGGVLPGMPLPRDWFHRKVVHKATSVEALATAIGVPPAELRATIDRYNLLAKQGRDEDFHRGDSAYDRYYGDPTLVNPCLDEITVPPFYAVAIVPGDLGTKGGLETDEHARVLRSDGSPIHGLYACGNVSASVMGRDYAGAGATIGPAITFGWIAACHAAGVPFEAHRTAVRA